MGIGFLQFSGPMQIEEISPHGQGALGPVYQSADMNLLVRDLLDIRQTVGLLLMGAQPEQLSLERPAPLQPAQQSARTLAQHQQSYRVLHVSLPPLAPQQ